MLTLRRSAALRIAAGTHKTHQGDEVPATAAVPAEKVREMLLEIAFVLHATRVVGRTEVDVAAKKGSRKLAAKPVR